MKRTTPSITNLCCSSRDSDFPWRTNAWLWGCVFYLGAGNTNIRFIKRYTAALLKQRPLWEFCPKCCLWRDLVQDLSLQSHVWNQRLSVGMPVCAHTNYLVLYHRASQNSVAKTPGIHYVIAFVDQEPGASKPSSSSSESLRKRRPTCRQGLPWSSEDLTGSI